MTCCARHILATQDDFKSKKPLLQELIEARGHKIIFYPKFHCELNYIEMYWGLGKHITRKQCDYKWDSLIQTVPAVLDSISLLTIRKFARKSRRYLDSYRQEKDGKQAEEDQKAHAQVMRKYKSYWRIDMSYMNEVDKD